MSALEQLKIDIKDQDDVCPDLCLVRIADLALALAVIEAAKYYASSPEALDQALAAITKSED